MDDLNTVWSIGFSGRAAEAAVIATFLSLLLKKYADVWKYAGYALGIDQALPILLHVTEGVSATANAAWLQLAAIPTNVGELCVRFVGLMIIITAAFAARSALHNRFA